MLEMDLIERGDGLTPYVALATTSVGVPDRRNSGFVPYVPLLMLLLVTNAQDNGSLFAFLPIWGLYW